MGKILLGLVVLALVFGGFYYFNDSPSDITGSIVNEPSNDKKTFSLEGESFRFLMNDNENPDIKVNEGDLVRIEFSNNQGIHDWVLEGYDVSTEIIGAGESTFVEFVADEKGTFDYYCSVGQHREFGMEGRFIVE